MAEVAAATRFALDNAIVISYPDGHDRCILLSPEVLETCLDHPGQYCLAGSVGEALTSRKEIVLAQRATVAYGSELLYMQSFLTVADHVRSSNMFWTAVRTRRDAFTGEHTGNGAELLRISEIMHWLRATRLQSTHFDQMLKALYGDFGPENRVYACLAWLLSVTRIFEATDPRDKIYSLIGLLDNFCDNLRDIQADYSKDTEHVFYETTAMLLEYLPGLNIFAQREDRPRLESSNLPSWVPNFASANVSGDLLLRNAANANAPPCNIFASSSQIDSYVPPPRSLSIHDNELHLTGIPYATISTCGTLIPSSISVQIDYNHRQLSTAAFLLRACKAIGPTYHDTGVPTATACADTITTGILSSSDSSSSLDSRARCFSAWISVILIALGPSWARAIARPAAESLCEEIETLQAELIHNGTIPWLKEDLARVKEETHARTEVEELGRNRKSKGKQARAHMCPGVTLDRSGQLVQHMHKHTATSKPFLTAERRMLGICPRSAVPGDRVWLLHGARVPFVLRRVPGTGFHRLVGEAYLEGVMHGEAVADGLAEGSRAVVIV